MKKYLFGVAILWAFLPVRAIGVIEMEMPLQDTKGHRISATLAVVFPDSLAGTDVYALVAATSGTGSVLLPHGKLRPEESIFIDGLRAFLKENNPAKTDSIWARLQSRRMKPDLQSAFNVDKGLLSCLRGELELAESIWNREWKSGAPAKEGAWRNLLGLYLAQERFSFATWLIDAVLKREPHNRMAALAKASLLRQLRPDSEWEDFLRLKSDPKDSLPYLQLAYGNLLLSQQKYSEAVKFLDFGLAMLPREGKSWRLLAEAQYNLGYYYFALDCLRNAERSGYHEADLYELYARVLRACCMGEQDPRAEKSRQEVERILEEGLPKDLHSRTMAQLLYHIYCQNLKPDAARQLKESLWFHFEGPPHSAPALGYQAWPHMGLEAQGLRIRFGLTDFTRVLALRDSDLYNETF